MVVRSRHPAGPGTRPRRRSGRPPRPTGRRIATGLLAGLVAVAAPACGRSAHRDSVAQPSGACAPAVRAVIARQATIPAPTTVAATPFTTPSGAPGCRFAVPRPSGRPLTVAADIDSAPQAYPRLDRQTVEYSQNVLWSHLGAGAYPRTVAGLGLAADWFPAERRLLATDGSQLVDVVVTWPGARPGTEQALAEAVARPYLQRG